MPAHAAAPGLGRSGPLVGRLMGCRSRINGACFLWPARSGKSPGKAGICRSDLCSLGVFLVRWGSGSALLLASLSWRRIFFERAWMGRDRMLAGMRRRRFGYSHASFKYESRGMWLKTILSGVRLEQSLDGMGWDVQPEFEGMIERWGRIKSEWRLEEASECHQGDLIASGRRLVRSL